jgi:glycine hydroxymethyltransferase
VAAPGDADKMSFPDARNPFPMFTRNRTLADADPELWDAIAGENKRQEDHIELIASENYASSAVMAAQGSQLTNKYAEGYPGKRYYGGCEFVDVAETLAIDRAKELFGAEHANVQPHSGAQANMSVYVAMLKPGDTILGMNLAHRPPDTRLAGQRVRQVVQRGSYGLDPPRKHHDAAGTAATNTGQARRCRRVRVFGHRLATLPRDRRLGGRLLMVDMAHAGLIAAGLPSPVGIADFVTTTTHQTLRRPAAG